MPGEAPYLFAGGGTGGHLFPGIAVAEELRRRRPGTRILFVGSERPIDQRILAQSGFETAPLPTESLATLKRAPWRFAWRMFRALRIAWHLIRDRRPAAVIGLGGFASGPVVWAASRRRIPVILLEQNVIPGRATRWLSRWAETICLSFDETTDRLASGNRARCRVTGNPVRQEIAAMAGAARREPSVESGRPTLLVLGGSLGSRSLNTLMTTFASESPTALSGWRIMHQAGDEANVIRGRYPTDGLDVEVRPFLEDMPAWLRRADLVVGRAGATTLAEIACAGLPAVLVPFPHAADDHQRANAEAYVRSGAAAMVLERSEVTHTLAEFRATVLPLLADADRRAAASRAMRSLARPHAAVQVADIVEQTARPSIEV